MKTTIDAVNEFKGEWPFADSTMMICCHKDTTQYSAGEFSTYHYTNFDHLNEDFFKPVCTKEEFNKCVSDCSSALIQKAKPIYTNQMKEAGEFPSAGMTFRDGVVLVVADSHEMYVVSISGVSIIMSLPEIKPLTPPIELIDGKAYQFNFADDKVMFGIYNSDRNIFSIEQGTYFDFNRVYNIQLLEVK